MVPSRSLCVALVLLCGQFAAAQTVVNSTYLGQCQGNYGDPNCWSPAVVPNNSPPAKYNVSIGAGSSVTEDIDATISNLNLAGFLSVSDKTFAVVGSTAIDMGGPYSGVVVSGSNAPGLFDAGALAAFS